MDTDKCHSVDLDFKSYDLTEDNQFSENPTDFGGDYSLGNMSGEKKLHGSSLVDIDNQVPETTLSRELECAQRTGRYNLRKSLAWDSAFFTSAGVLDQQELSSIITGENKSEQFLLPGIEEDISGSTDSISTLESGNLNLESVDEDLFLDIRASIQRSSKKQSNFATSISKSKKPVDIDSSAVSSLKTEESALVKKNLKPGVEKTSGLQAIRMPNCISKPNKGNSGPAKAIIKQDSSNSSQIKSISKVAETSSSLVRPPKDINGPIPALPPPAKKDSVGTARVKSETSVSSKGGRSPKPSIPNGARRMVSSNISSVSSTTSRLSSVRSSTSSNSSSSISSVTSTKSSPIMPKRNPAKAGHVRSGLSSPKPTPLTASQKNKPPHSTLSTLSTKISSNASPTSSMSEWSSASSSSVMFSPRSSNLRNSIETGSCRSVDSGITVLDLQSNSADEIDEHERTQGVALLGKNVDISSVQKGKIPAPARPSGLRRPSPKIGYFDGVKSARTNGPPLPSVLPKAGSSALCSPARNSNGKVKSNKVPLPRARFGTSPAKIKLDSSKGEAFSSPFPEKSDDVGNCGCHVMELKDTSGLPLEVATIPVPKNLGESEIVRAEGGVEKAVDVHGTTIIKKNICNKISETKLNMPKNPSNGDVKNAIEGCELSSLENINWSENTLVNVNNNQDVSAHPICGADDNKNDILQHQTERNRQ